MDHAPPRPRTAPLLLAVGLAHAGGVVAYLPLITLLLPMRVEALAHLAKIDLLTAAVLAGGMAASLANIVFGWLSDVSAARGGGRRRWVIAGLVALAASYPAMAFARTPVELVGAVVLAQAAINAVLGPLFAIIAEEVPTQHKGMAGGLLALGNPVAAGFSVLLMGYAGLGENTRFLLVPVAAVALMLPLLALRADPAEGDSEAATSWPRRDIVIASLARLLVQLACATLGLYLLYYFQTLRPGGRDTAAWVGSVRCV